MEYSSQFWEEYERNCCSFDNNSVYEAAGRLCLIWQTYLYTKVDSIKQVLTDLANQKISDPDNLHFQESEEDEDRVFSFARDLHKAMSYSRQYVGGEFKDPENASVIFAEIKRKGCMDLQDVQNLNEYIETVNSLFEYNKSLLLDCDPPEFSVALDLFKGMPHGRERQNALDCMNRAVHASFTSICEDMEYSLLSINDMIGDISPEADSLLDDFLDGVIAQYPDLEKDDKPYLRKAIHAGVLASYVIPAYKQLPDNAAQLDEAVCFIDGYEDMEPGVQEHIMALTEFYAGKVMEEASSVIKPDAVSENLDSEIRDFFEYQKRTNELSVLCVDISNTLKEEKKISAAYQRYLYQKMHSRQGQEVTLPITNRGRDLE